MKTDFLISPAYSVPPMITIRRARLTRMKVSLRVPSRFGSAFTDGSEIDREVGLEVHQLVGVGPDEEVVGEKAVPGVLA